jgi:hypothetical protein
VLKYTLGLYFGSNLDRLVDDDDDNGDFISLTLISG